MKDVYAWDRFRSVALLLVTFLVIEFTYSLHVRPSADAWLAYEKRFTELHPMEAAPQSIYVIIKDPEQESCVVLTIWGLGLAFMRYWGIRKQRKVLDANIMGMAPGLRILPDDVLALDRSLDGMPAPQQRYVVVQAARRALQRFGVTGNVQDASSSVHNSCESEATRFDSELSSMRFVTWAIPAIGFIGTVRGIGLSLQSANIAMQGDASAVTAGLGVAFNSTLVALVLSIFLMLVMHELQRLQERLVLDCENYLDEELISRMQPA